jgi:electron transport complex protein RnfG
VNVKEILKITLNLVIIYAVGGALLAGVYAMTSPIIFKNKKEDKEAALKAMMPVHLKMNVPEGSADGVKEALAASIGMDSGEAGEGLISLDAQVDVYKSDMKRFLKKLRKAGAKEIEQYSTFKTVKVGDWEPWHKHAEVFEATDESGPAGYIVESFGKGYSSYPNVYVAVDKEFRISKLEVLSHAETPGLGDEIMLDWFKDQYKGKGLEQLEVIKGPTEDKIQAITGATISTRAVTYGARDAVKVLREKYEGKEMEYSWVGGSGLKDAVEEAGEERGEEEEGKDEH